MALKSGGAKKTWREKVGLAEMLKGGVIMDVTCVEHAKIAEDAGAVAVMALERVPADIRRDGGVARMSDPEMIIGIKNAVTIPVMAKCRIGHFVEAEILEALEVDFIDESEVLTPADEENHVDKHPFNVPFVCGARNLGEALRRISEGAALIRTKGEAGIRQVASCREDELYGLAKEHQAPIDLVRQIRKLGRLPVPNFSAGGIATPADAAMMMKLGAETVFVGSGIFKSSNPAVRAKAIVESVLFYQDAAKLAEISRNLGEAMFSIAVASLGEKEQMAVRGW